MDLRRKCEVHLHGMGSDYSIVRLTQLPLELLYLKKY